MRGTELVRIVEAELSRRGISKAEFYKSTGISSATFSQWRSGQYDPSPSKVEAIEEFLNVHFEETDDAPMIKLSQEEMDILESLRERDDLKILMRSGRNVPPSSIYSLIATLEKEKEKNL